MIICFLVSPVASNPGDKVNKPNPQTLPKPLPHQVPTSKANASKTKPPVNPNLDLATMNSFLEKLTVLQSQMENVVAQQKYFSQVVMPPRWTSPQDPSIPHWTPHPAMSLYRPNATPICPTLPVLNPEHGPHMYNFLFLNIRRLLLKSGTDKTTIGNTRVSVAYYSFCDNIQLYEPLGKALLFTSIS